jgi:hypothetical protein
LQENGNDIAFIGEAYLSYKFGNTNISAGRMQLFTPLAGGYDVRSLATTYEAATIQNKDISDTFVELGYIRSFTGFGSSYGEFRTQKDKWGDKGLGYIFIKNNSIANLTLQAQYIKAISKENSIGNDIDIKDYIYADLNYKLPYGKNTFIGAQYGHNDYVNDEASNMYGVKLGTTVLDNFDLAVIHNGISGSNFASIMAGPIYSDWQQGYIDFSSGKTFGGYVKWHISDDLYLKAGYMHIDADVLKDKDNEYNIDAQYNIDKASNIRIRYSDRKRSPEYIDEEHIAHPTSAGPNRNDFRVIYNYFF